MENDHQIHASCVAWQGRGALILGASGAGKSGLALQLMAMGCALVADDRVDLRKSQDGLVASGPDTIAGLIEARGIGVLRAPGGASATVALAVDMDQSSTERIPSRQMRQIAGFAVPIISRVEAPYFAAAVLQILKTGWSDR